MRITGIQSRMLDDDGDVGTNDGRIRGVAGNGLGFGQIVEPQVPRTVRIDTREIGAHGRSVFEKG